MDRIIYKINKNYRSLDFVISIIIFVVSYTLLSLPENDLFKVLYEENKFEIQNSLTYGYTFFLIVSSILIVNALVYNSLAKAEDYQILINQGLSRISFLKALVKTHLSQLVIVCLIGLAIGVFLSEFFNLLTIVIFDLKISNHNFTIEIWPILYTFFFMVISYILSSLIITANFSKKYINDKKDSGIAKKIFMCILIIATIIAIIKNLSYGVYAFIIILIDLSIILSSLKIIENKTNKNNGFNPLVKSFIVDFLKKDKLSLVLIMALFILAQYYSYFTITGYLSYKLDQSTRPDFTLLVSEEKINELYNFDNYSKYVEDLYPLYISEINNIDDYDFNLDLYKNSITNKTDFYEKIYAMNYSTYKNIYKSNRQNHLDNDEVIYLATNKDNYVRKIDSFIKEKKEYIKINDKKYKIVSAQSSDTIFANISISRDNIFVFTDEVFKSLIDYPYPIAYNLNLSKDYIEKYNYDGASEDFRQKLIKNNFKLESLVWMKNNYYTNFLRSISISLYVALVMIFVASSILTIRFLNFLEDNKKSFEIMRDLGESSFKIKEIIRKFVIKESINIYFIISLIYFISLVLSYIIFETLIFNQVNLVENILSALLIPLFLGLVIFIMEKVVLSLFLSERKLGSYEKNTYN